MSLLSSPEVSGWQRGGWALPPSSFTAQAGTVIVGQTQSGGFKSHQHAGGVIAGRNAPVDPAVLAITSIDRAGGSLTVKSLLLERCSVVIHVGVSRPRYPTVIPHEQNYMAD
jgi:hypothetical protein